MRRQAVRQQKAFSLLEVIIATAILAGSALVLFSLISLGTKYGNRAEERTIAVSQAQSVLDEFIARMPSGEIREEVNGILPSIPPRNFRIVVTPFEFRNNIGADGSAKTDRNEKAANENQTILYRVMVEILETSTNLPSMDSKPLCQLTRLVRNPRIEPSADGYGGETSRPSANKNRSNRKAGGIP